MNFVATASPLTPSIYLDVLSSLIVLLSLQVNNLVFVTAVNPLVGTVKLFPVGTSELADIEPDVDKVCPVSLTSVILLALLPIKRTV